MNLLVSLSDLFFFFLPLYQFLSLMCYRQFLCLYANGSNNLPSASLKPFFLFSLHFLCSCLLVWLCRAHIGLFLDNAVCIISPPHLWPAVKLHCLCAPFTLQKKGGDGERRESERARRLPFVSGFLFFSPPQT